MGNAPLPNPIIPSKGLNVNKGKVFRDKYTYLKEASKCKQIYKPI